MTTEAFHLKKKKTHKKTKQTNKQNRSQLIDTEIRLVVTREKGGQSEQNE